MIGKTHWLFAIFVAFVIFVAKRSPWRVAAQAPQPLIELTAGSGATLDRRLLAIRMR
jgi:hypothetical protein